jgi:hypothetical protein
LFAHRKVFTAQILAPLAVLFHKVYSMRGKGDLGAIGLAIYEKFVIMNVE